MRAGGQTYQGKRGLMDNMTRGGGGEKTGGKWVATQNKGGAANLARVGGG